ncbi:hypothetical protein HPB47_025451 [Ixodes persulcatus]|uniref:Uncharacterized protein n=1 Tax=Ixodes persulcatus TaxID=34615 RepID=A0AC60Q1F2_IXOPE|nr:hypothetical protein HPB47_025451 [Ixodes persulcatus]
MAVIWMIVVEQQYEAGSATLLDSMGRPPAGMLSGRMADYGAYDQCLSIRHPQNQFRGKYCMIQMMGNGKLAPSMLKLVDKLMEHHNLKYAGNISKVLELEGDKMQMALFKLGSCMPSVCRREDLQFILDSGTTLSRIALSFSLRRSSLKLVQMPAWGDYSDKLGFLYGMRVLSAAWIVKGHSYILRDFRHSSDFLVFVKRLQNDFVFSVDIQFCLAVGTFFAMTGFLSGYLATNKPQPKISGFLLVVSGLVRRYIRFVPSVAALLGVWYLVPLVASGPSQDDLFFVSRKSCDESWWKLFTMTQNYADNVADMCLPHLWYVCVDFQLSVIRIILMVVVVPSRSGKHCTRALPTGACCAWAQFEKSARGSFALPFTLSKHFARSKWWATQCDVERSNYPSRSYQVPERLRIGARESARPAERSSTFQSGKPSG